MDTTIQPFWKNKLFWTGLIGAAIVAAQQFFSGNSEISYVNIGIAVLIAIAGYVATTLRGQNTTMTTLIANTIVAVIASFIYDPATHDAKFELIQFFGQLMTIILGVVAPDAKPLGYERTNVIRTAKIQGQIATPNALVDKNIKEAAAADLVQANGNVDIAVNIAKNK